MNESSSEHGKRRDVTEETAQEFADLHSLAELLNLKVEKESRYEGINTIVVKNEKDVDVHIGFPYGTKGSHGNAYKPAATARIEGVPMTPFGHGSWHYYINI